MKEKSMQHYNDHQIPVIQQDLKDDIEIRKTRLDIVLKLFYPFITVLGALVAYFAKKLPNALNYGNVLFLGFAAFLIVMLFTMVRYMFFELRCLKQNKEESLLDETSKADTSYDNIFKCFSIGGKGLIVYVLVLVILMMYFAKAFDFIKPTEVHMAISFALSLFLSFLPNDVCFTVSVFKVKNNITAENNDFEGLGEKKAGIPIYSNNIKKLQWMTWSVFVFKLLYIVWF